VAEDKPLTPKARSQTEQSAIPNEVERDVNCSESVPHLPAVFRSAMILSHLEGFSASEIGRLAGVQPRAIESLLVRGRELMREEFRAYVKSFDDANEIANRAEDSLGPPEPGGAPASVELDEP